MTQQCTSTNSDRLPGRGRRSWSAIAWIRFRYRQSWRSCGRGLSCSGGAAAGIYNQLILFVWRIYIHPGRRKRDSRDNICQPRPDSRKLGIRRDMVPLRVWQPGYRLLCRFRRGRVEDSELNRRDIGGLFWSRTRRRQVAHRYFDINGADLVRACVVWEGGHWTQSREIGGDFGCRLRASRHHGCSCA